MKRSLLLTAMLLCLAPASAAPKNYGSITTREGKTYFDCQVMRIYPDGVSFAHRNGAAKIAFADLPESLRAEFRYDPKVEAEYQKEQAALRKAEEERQRKQEIVMHERLMEARMAEASYLATASKIAATPSTSAGGQTPSWVGTPITGPAVGGYGRRSYSSYGYGGYGYGGGYYSGYGYPSYGGYSYGSYPYGGYYGGGYSPTIFGSWNVGHGIHIGIGGGGGFGFGGHHHH
jgi:hypothetical protein